MNKFTEEDDFILAFGEQKFRMKSFFAEFISPVISHLHKSDPTIQTIKFDDLIHDEKNDFNEFIKDILTDETIYLLQQLSSGSTIEIDANQAFKMRFLSIILGNEELFSILNTNFPPEFTEDNFEIYLKYAECCYHFSQFSPDFDFSNIINNLSSNFYSVDQNEFLKLSRRIQYMILSNPNLQIKSEDSLLDLVLQIIEKDGEEIDNISFLEQIEFTGLSESKLRSFLSYFDINQLTNSLWQKLFQCFFIHFDKKMNRIEKNNHFIKRTVIDYDEYKTDHFGGIIHHLTDQCGGNVDSKGVCKITSSSVFNNFKAPNVADFSSNIHFCSMFDVNSWLMIDFKERKVHPTFYSIRSYHGKDR